MSVEITNSEKLVLDALQKGATLSVTKISPVSAIFTNNDQEFVLAIGDVFSLAQKGLIEIESEDQFYIKYVLTEAGRIWPNDVEPSPPAPVLFDIPARKSFNWIFWIILIVLAAVIIIASRGC